MKIAVIGNFDKEIKPNSKGGTELFTYSLVEELIKKPEIESILVFGVGKDYFENEKVKFVSILPQERSEFIAQNKFLSVLSENRPDFDAEVRFGVASEIFKILISSQVDLIHDNSTSLVFTSLSKLLPSPIVTTLHTNVMSPSIMIPYSLNLLSKDSRKQFFVSIANHQQEFTRGNDIKINIVQTIYNGIDLRGYEANFETKQNQHGFWLGGVRRKHNKGLKESIIVAEKIKKDLDIAAQIDDKDFFEKEMQPLMGQYSHMVYQPQNIEEKNDLYARSSYFIYPIQWEEPFGLVFLEAMASGTPVIAYARGAVPEIIVDGKTGFIVNSSDEDIRGDFIIKKTGIEGLCEAVKRISEMQDDEYGKMRIASRERVEKNFTLGKMVDEYVEVYKKILGI